MATKSEFAFGPAAMTEGYSMNGSQANSVALNPGGSLRGGKRFSVRGPVRGSPRSPPPANAAATTIEPSARNKRRGVTAGVSGERAGGRDARKHGTAVVRIRTFFSQP